MTRDQSAEGSGHGESTQLDSATTALASRLLEVVRTLAVEMAPERARMTVSLDADLDRTLGFDSLSRMELLLRLERALDVRFSETDFSQAETPRDLLQAAVAATRTTTVFPPAADSGPLVLGAADAIPPDIDTLQEVLAWRARHQGERTHVLLYEADGDVPVGITFGDLHQASERLAAGLIAEQLKPGEAVAIMLPTSRDYLETFFGVLLAGGTPVPIYPPARPSQLEDHLRRHAKILANAGAAVLVTVPEGLKLGRLLKHQVEGLRAVLTPEALRAHESAYMPVPASPGDVAFLQYTSGSTGQPKGVILTHADLLANIRAMGDWVHASSEDVFVSWLPLYHDMGLIGAWLGSLYHAMLSVLMPPTAFLTRPARWLEAVHQHRATITAAPNFAWALCVSRIPDEVVAGLDLSSLRLIFNGAEPVRPETLRAFRDRFQPAGLDPTAISPVYGLAESAVGLAFPPLGRGPLIDRVRREPFERRGQAMPVSAGESGLEFVACGQPLGGYEIRIVDDSDRELGDREVGHLQFRGPSATQGYRANPEATAQLFHDGWLDSGDLAYVAEGDVYLTSRVKDLIIRAGRNLYPYDLEEAVGNLEGIRKGCVAVFGSRGTGTDLERLIVVAETRETQPARLDALAAKIQALSNDILGTPPDDVLLARPRTVLKTSSGKIRRAGCRALYEQGELGRSARSPGWQVIRLWFAGFKPRWRRARKATGDLLYAGYAYVCFALLMPLLVAALALLPGLHNRWRAVAIASRALLWLCRVPWAVDGLSNLPADGRCVLVANHASYLDGVLLIASLPSPATFVVKAELKAKPFARWFLNRLNARYVERFDADQGFADARRLSEAAAEGAPLCFFPEGTFTRQPGLLAFHMGAFVTGAQNGMPVIPITLRGTRSVLRSDGWFPRRGTVAVIIGEAIAVGKEASSWDVALSLRNQARAAILRHLGEPDLALQRGTL